MNDSRRSILWKTTGLASALTGITTASAKRDENPSWERGRGKVDESDGDKETEDESNVVDEENPTGPDGEWTLSLDEQWKTFDENRWAVGFIDHEDWIPDDDASVSGDHVIVDGGQCILQIESEGTGPSGCYQGVINSSTGGEDWHPNEGVAIDPEPGQYMEARIKMPGRTGILPGFWSHPANMDWPPEIDFVELFQWGNDERADRETLHVNAHWTSTGEPGDMDNHEHNPHSIDTGVDLTETFNTYGCAWFEDRVEWYFNGEHILTRDDPAVMLETLTDDRCSPFGMIFSNHVNRLGEANLDEAWVEEMVIDWVRVWEFNGESPESTEETDRANQGTLLDDFDGGQFADGWYQTGSWKLVNSPASSGSHSAFVNQPWSRLTWDGDVRFERGTTLAVDFAFDDSSDQQLNVRFGDTDTDATSCYRLDIHRDEIVLLDTDGWNWLGGDRSYENESVDTIHTAEIEFRDGEIAISVDGSSNGAISLSDSSYSGSVIHFDIEAGGVYIDEVRLVD